MPAGTDTACSFSPASVTGNGQTTLTVTTTAATAMNRDEKPFLAAGALACFAAFCLPFGIRGRTSLRRYALPALALFAVVVANGCGSGKPAPITSSGTPPGIEVVTVITSVAVDNQAFTQRQYISVNVVQ